MMSTRKVLLTNRDARPSKKQHVKPCSDCPWRRDSLPGWLGSGTPASWVAAAHSDEKIPCHVHSNQQCAGSSIYRANVCKVSRDATVLRLPADREAVFEHQAEFKGHHRLGD